MTPDGSGNTVEGDLDFPGGEVTVLLVDDDATWARTNARVLERQRAAFAVTTATDLDGASESYAESDPDCVVCDYQLDRGTGLDLLAEVRERDPDRPFVLVTGEGSEAVASDAIGSRVTDYVRKSAVADRTDLLARLVERAVRTYRTERALERERRSKDAMLDLVTATATRQGLADDFCRHLVDERGYEAAWLGTYSPAEGIVPRAVAGGTAYPDRVIPSGTTPDAGDEPALVALAEERPCVVDDVDPGLENGDQPAGDRGERTTSGGSTNANPDPREGGPASWRRLAWASGFRSAAAVPVVHDGSVVGVLAVYADDVDAVNDSERDLLVDYGTTIGFALRTAEWKQSLLAASPVTVDFLVRDDRIPLVALRSRLPGEASIVVRTAVQRAESQILYVARVRGASAEAVRSAAEDLDGVDLASVGSESESPRYEFVVDGPTPESLIVDRGGRFVRTSVADGSATVSVAAATREAVPELEAVLEDVYGGVSIASLRSDADVDVTSPLADLTDKQRQALELAFYEGFFERPRRNNATEVASKLGVSRATFTQHVRAAERKVLGHLLDRPD